MQQQSQLLGKTSDAATKFSNQSDFFLLCRRKPLTIFAKSFIADVRLSSIPPS